MALDQKKLREMMKKEKEKRAAETRAARIVHGVTRTVGIATTAGEVPGGRKVAGTAPAPAAEDRARLVPEPAMASRASLRKENGLEELETPPHKAASTNRSAEVDANDVTPAVKRARADTNAMPPPMLPVLASRGKSSTADALAMPPPALPSSKKGDPLAMLVPPTSPAGAKTTADIHAMPPPALPAKKHGEVVGEERYSAKVSVGKTSAEARVDDALPDGFFDGPEEASCSLASVVGGTPADTKGTTSTGGDVEMANAGEIAAQGDASGAMESATEEDVGDGFAPSSLPAGFFDDPEKDAKARGVEAPSIKAERELEEGLKRFEREMAVEQEAAEETRHELDEKRYERVAAEEADFHAQLQKRAEELRKRANEQLQVTSARAAPLRETEVGSDAELGMATEDAVADDSGSDVEFDWRAKGFS